VYNSGRFPWRGGTDIVTKTRIQIPAEPGETVSGILTIPENLGEDRPAVIVAHGAGNDMTNPLIVAFADGLARAGHPSLRFNFPYKEKGKKAPDRQNVLERTWTAAYEYLQEKTEFISGGIVAAGKSMGGRIASQLASEGRLSVDRLIYLGYPLHPPGKKDRLRDAHLYLISIPMLFFAGTRDSLCDLDRLRSVLSDIAAPWELEIIEGGDHSFKTPRSSGLDHKLIYDRIVKKSIAWMAAE